MRDPLIVNLQVVRTCNLRCTFCSHDRWAEPTGMMTWATFELALGRCREDAADAICFVSAQGESLLHPRIFDMLQACHDAGFETNLVTNGTPLSERRIAGLAALGLDAVQFSFAGWDKESYERLYIGARFEQVSRNLSLLIEALRGTRTRLTVNGVVDQVDGIAKTMGYVLSLGAEHVTVGLPHNWGGTVRAGREQDGIWSHREIDRGAFKLCPLLKTQGIYIDGRVTACGCIDANGALTIGDIADGPLRSMRQGARYRDIVAAFEAGDVSRLPLCGSCEIPYHS